MDVRRQQIAFERFDSGHDIPGHPDRIGAGLLGDADGHHGSAGATGCRSGVYPRIGFRQGGTVFDPHDVVQVHRRAVDHVDQQGVQF